MKITLTLGKISINDNINTDDLNKKINIDKICIVRNDNIQTKIKNFDTKLHKSPQNYAKMLRYNKLTFNANFFENLTSAYDFALLIGGGSERENNFIHISDDISAIIMKIRHESIKKYKNGDINEKIAKYAQWLHYWCEICREIYGKRAFIYAEISY